MSFQTGLNTLRNNLAVFLLYKHRLLGDVNSHNSWRLEMLQEVSVQTINHGHAVKRSGASNASVYYLQKSMWALYVLCFVKDLLLSVYIHPGNSESCTHSCLWKVACWSAAKSHRCGSVTSVKAQRSSSAWCFESECGDESLANNLSIRNC